MKKVNLLAKSFLFAGITLTAISGTGQMSVATTVSGTNGIASNNGNTTNGLGTKCNESDKHDGVVNGKGNCAKPSKRARSGGGASSTEPLPAELSKIIKKTVVYFTPQSAVITSKGKRTLRTLAAALVKAQYADAVVDVRGWVYPINTRADNMRVSTARAKNVAAYLRSLGISGAYAAKGYGRLEKKSPSSRRVNVAVHAKLKIKVEKK